MTLPPQTGATQGRVDAAVERLGRWANGEISNAIWGRQSRPAHIGAKRADLRTILTALSESERARGVLEAEKAGHETAFEGIVRSKIEAETRLAQMTENHSAMLRMYSKERSRADQATAEIARTALTASREINEDSND